MRHIISVLLENEAGALSRVVGLFSARGYNIETLTVAPTEDATLSRMTIVTSGSDDVIEQMVGQARAPDRCLVATDDRAERQTIEAMGAAGLSAADLAAWMDRAEQRQQSRLAERRRANEKDWRRPPS